MHSPATANRTRPPRLAIVLAAGVMAAAVFAAPAAHAQATVTVAADRAKVVRVVGEPATVAVGNPMYADVTVREGLLIVHGKMYGTTNIIALDADGKEIAQFDVNVVRAGRQNVTVYKAGARYSLNCAGLCENDLQVGDDPGFFDNVISKQISTKSGLAAGSSK